jgi:hypothetical protein
MNKLIESNIDAIRKLCETNKVSSLYSFGSINTSGFNKESDVDLLVEFKIEDPLEYADKYFDLKFSLEKVFNRSVDLIESKAIKNRYLKQTIDKSKVLIYRW